VRACELESAAALAAETERDLAHARLRSIQDEADEKRRMSCPLPSSPFPPNPTCACAHPHTRTPTHTDRTPPRHPIPLHTTRRDGCARAAVRTCIPRHCDAKTEHHRRTETALRIRTD
jgi:hypothetical protein